MALVAVGGCAGSEWMNGVVPRIHVLRRMKREGRVQGCHVEAPAVGPKPYRPRPSGFPGAQKLGPCGPRVSQLEGRTLVTSQRGFETNEQVQIARSDQTHFRRSLEPFGFERAWGLLGTLSRNHQGQLLRKGSREGFWGCEVCAPVHGIGGCGSWKWMPLGHRTEGVERLVLVC